MFSKNTSSVENDKIAGMVSASLLAYFVAFVLPTVGNFTQKYFNGFQAFGIAFLALADMEGFVWLANPFYWAVVIALLRGSRSVYLLILSTIAVLIAASFVFLSPVPISDILVGYYVWLGTLTLALLASVCAFWSANSASPTESPQKPKTFAT